MNILLIEDDVPKENQIRELLTTNLLSFDHASCINSAISLLDQKIYDCVLLDMSLPTFSSESSGGRQRDLGGRQILTYMWEMELNPKVMLVTQLRGFRDDDGSQKSLAELDEVLRGEFPGLYRGYIYFHHNSDAWMREIKSFLEEK